MQWREFWMQRQWLLHLLWHLLMGFTLTTWNMTRLFKEWFWARVLLAIGYVGMSNPAYVNRYCCTPAWFQLPNYPSDGEIIMIQVTQLWMFCLEFHHNCVVTQPSCDMYCTFYHPIWPRIICGHTSGQAFSILHDLCIAACMGIGNLNFLCKQNGSH